MDLDQRIKSNRRLSRHSSSPSSVACREITVWGLTPRLLTLPSIWIAQTACTDPAHLNPCPTLRYLQLFWRSSQKNVGLALEFAKCVKSRSKNEQGAGRTGESGFKVEPRSRLDLEEPAARTVRRKGQSRAKDRECPPCPTKGFHKSKERSNHDLARCTGKEEGKGNGLATKRCSRVGGRHAVRKHLRAPDPAITDILS